MVDVRALDFFSTAAQVIPVIFLVVVFEARKVGVRVNPDQDTLAVALTAFCLIAGEAAALRVLSTGEPTAALHTVVSVSLVLGLNGIVFLMAAETALTVDYLTRRSRWVGAAVLGVYLLAIDVTLALIAGYSW